MVKEFLRDLIMFPYGPIMGQNVGVASTTKTDDAQKEENSNFEELESSLAGLIGGDIILQASDIRVDTSIDCLRVYKKLRERGIKDISYESLVNQSDHLGRCCTTPIIPVTVILAKEELKIFYTLEKYWPHYHTFVMYVNKLPRYKKDSDEYKDLVERLVNLIKSYFFSKLIFLSEIKKKSYESSESPEERTEEQKIITVLDNVGKYKQVSTPTVLNLAEEGYIISEGGIFVDGSYPQKGKEEKAFRLAKLYGLTISYPGEFGTRRGAFKFCRDNITGEAILSTITYDTDKHTYYFVSEPASYNLISKTGKNIYFSSQKIIYGGEYIKLKTAISEENWEKFMSEDETIQFIRTLFKGEDNMDNLEVIIYYKKRGKFFLKSIKFQRTEKIGNSYFFNNKYELKSYNSVGLLGLNYGYYDSNSKYKYANDMTEFKRRFELYLGNEKITSSFKTNLFSIQKDKVAIANSAFAFYCTKSEKRISEAPDFICHDVDNPRVIHGSANDPELIDLLKKVDWSRFIDCPRPKILLVRFELNKEDDKEEINEIYVEIYFSRRDVVSRMNWEVWETDTFRKTLTFNLKR